MHLQQLLLGENTSWKKPFEVIFAPHLNYFLAAWTILGQRFLENSTLFKGNHVIKPSARQPVRRSAHSGLPNSPKQFWNFPKEDFHFDYPPKCSLRTASFSALIRRLLMNINYSLEEPRKKDYFSPFFVRWGSAFEKQRGFQDEEKKTLIGSLRIKMRKKYKINIMYIFSAPG